LSGTTVSVTMLVYAFSVAETGSSTTTRVTNMFFAAVGDREETVEST
jgi:hypothetical protein